MRVEGEVLISSVSGAQEILRDGKGDNLHLGDVLRHCCFGVESLGSLNDFCGEWV